VLPRSDLTGCPPSSNRHLFEMEPQYCRSDHRCTTDPDTRDGHGSSAPADWRDVRRTGRSAVGRLRRRPFRASRTHTTYEHFAVDVTRGHTTIRWEVTERVATVWLHRPHRHNPWTGTMHTSSGR
jgi:hypothetical protein